jgi:cell division septation protein DedD
VPAPPAVPTAPEPDPLIAAVTAATGGRTSATGPIGEAPSATSAPEAQPPQAEAPVQTATVAPTPGGAYQIQLASVLSEQAALAEWGRISGKNKDILGAYAPTVTRADLGEKGVFFRLRTGPLADKAAADALCASLAAANVGCIVVKP